MGNERYHAPRPLTPAEMFDYINIQKKEQEGFEKEFNSEILHIENKYKFIFKTTKIRPYTT